MNLPARLFTSLLLATACANAQQPKIVCEKPEHDFGHAEPNSVVNHDYVIRNAGDATLTLNNVRASCGCTVAKTSTNTLKPGETATITASLNLAGRSGQQTKNIVVESNDPVTQSLILTLRGGVRVDYDLQPPTLNPGAIRGDIPQDYEVIFQNNTTGLVHITQAAALTNSLAVTVEALTNGRTYRIRIKTVPPLAAGDFFNTVRIGTDNPARAIFEIPFTASILGALTVAPQSIIIAGPSTNPVTRYIILRPGSAQTFQIKSIEGPAPGISASTSPFGTVGTRITLNNIVPTADLNGKSIRITTDVPGMTEILVPIAIVPQQ